MQQPKGLKWWLRNRWFVILTFLTAVFSLVICLRIEVLNSRADHFLPNKGMGKARVAPAEAVWRKMNNIDLFRPLSSSESAAMEADAMYRETMSRNILLNFVSGYGLLQYLLAPAVVLIGFYGTFLQSGRIRWVFLFALSVGCFAGYRMFALNYLGNF